MSISINKKVIFTVATGLVLGASSCRKFLDVNTNPNITPTATLQTLLPAAQLTVGTALGVDLEINGSCWGGYWTQSPNASQYRSLEQYAPGQDYFDNPWTNLYKANENFYQLAKLADSSHNKHYKAIALLMQAYTFELITDGWGDAPFKQALKGQPADGGITSPKYDSQLVIYNGIMSYVDSAEILLSQSNAVDPTNDDLIYNGSISNWQKFGYTLKLKTLLRLTQVNPAMAQAGVLALYATPGVSFIDNTSDAQIAYGFNNTNNKNPLYAEMSSTTLNFTQNLVGSSTCIDSMNSNDDYRAYAFYEALSNGNVVGIKQGNYNTAVAAGTYSIPSFNVAGDAQNTASANAPVKFLTSYESYFLQAEVAARGWVLHYAGEDTVLFYKAISANFNAYSTQLLNSTGSDGPASYSIYVNGDVVNSIPPGYWAIYPTNGSVTAKVRHIITGKWFAMCGNQGFEAWTEFRRTGYPDFMVPSVNTLIGGSVVGGSAFPKRFEYPTSESTRNSAFPGVQPVTSRVWWDLF